MKSKIKRTLIVSSLVASLFMSLTACSFTVSSTATQSNNTSSQIITSIQPTQSSDSTSEQTTSSTSVVQIVLNEITVSSNKDSYEWGEDLDIVVTAHYSNDTTNVITDYQVSGYDSKVSGEQTITITYEGKTTSLNVTVNNPGLTNITVANNKDSYEWGEELDIVVTAHYADGSSKDINDYQVSGYNKEVSGEQNVTVTYEGKTASLKVRVNNPVLTKITVTSNKETYEWGEELDIVVTAYYSDGSSKTIEDYQVSGYDKEVSGEQNVTVTYEGKTASLKVKVNNPVLVSITAVTNKETYEWGEQLDIIVVAHYSDGSSVTVTGYSVDGYNNQVPGLQNLTITYEGKTCSLSVSIKERVNLFPVSALNTFLQVEDIETEVPSPIGYNSWENKIELEQDGSKTLIITTKDEGTFGVDSIADQYAALLKNNGWTVVLENNTYTATKEGGDVVLSFSTKSQQFSLRVESYCEFPDKTTTLALLKGRTDLEDGDKIILGSFDYQYVVDHLENGSFVTKQYPYADNGPFAVLEDIYPLTVRRVDNSWNLVDSQGRKLGATGLKQLAWDEGSTNWGILASGNSTIVLNSKTAYGSLRYDSASKTITNIKYNGEENLSFPQVFKYTQIDLVYPTAINIEGKNEVSIGKTTKLSVEYEPADSNVFNEVTWSSSDETVATVKDGVVTGKGAGQATITAVTKSKNNELQANFVVNVNETNLDSWTIMVYMCGSDLESGSYHFASADIREILSVNGQPDDVNVILETGGSRSWNYPGIASNALSRYHVENRALVLDEKLSNASMGSRSTFESFLNWGLKNYPAENTGVILWNHGGAIDGCCYDENYSYDCLTNSETSQAFKNVFEENGINKLEFVGYDACLMQIQDVAEFNSRYFNYMVGSEEAEDGYGWAYSEWLDDVYAGRDTHTILKEACDSFVASCGNNSDQCLAYLNLAKIGDYRDKFEAMVLAIKDTAKNNWNVFKNIIYSAKTFLDFSSYGVMDAYDFLTKLGNNSNYSAYKDQINEVKSAYKKVIGYNKAGTGAGQANGLAAIAALSYMVSYPSSETSFSNWRSLFK